MTQIDRFAVLLPAAEHAVAAGLPRDPAVGAKADRGRQFTVFAGAVNPHEGTIRELGGFFAWERLGTAAGCGGGGAAGGKRSAAKGGKQFLQHGKGPQ